MDGGGHHRQLVEAEFRARAVSLHLPSHHQTQGAQKVVPSAVAGKGLLCRASQLQAGGGPPLRALRQRSGLRADHLQPPTGPQQIQFHLHVVR